MSVFEYRQAPWEPMHPVEMVPRDKAEALTKGELPDELWGNAEYTAHLHYRTPLGRAGVLHLSIKRTDKRPAHDWRDLQAIKNEVCGPEREAVEIFPAESRLVDEADQTHLWVMPVGENVGIGWNERIVKDNAERVISLRDEGRPTTKGSQRAWRPGIPTGRGRE